MEGPAGWHSEFGRAGFASTGQKTNERPAPPNPLNDPPKPDPARTEPSIPGPPRQGDPTDAWDQPYGDASWGGQAARSTTPEQDKQAADADKKKPRRR
jgi:hypothetical protein